MLIGFLDVVTWHGSVTVLARLAQWLTPLLAPLGIQANNWPATVGLLTGLLAKEVVIATLNTLYSQLGHVALAHLAQFDVLAGLKTAVMSIPHNLANLRHAFMNPLLASAAPPRCQPCCLRCDGGAL